MAAAADLEAVERIVDRAFREAAHPQVDLSARVHSATVAS
jgi:hypothetical protein